MKKIHFRNAFYIKLGRNGEWEYCSIEDKRIRIGWHDQSLEDINNRNWEKIKKELTLPGSRKGVGTRDYNALKLVCESTNEDVWITFYSSKLWWTCVGENRTYEDNVSKFRKTYSKGWNDEDVDGNVLLINQISGIISKLQGFRGTICRVNEIDILNRIINNEPSQEFKNISKSKKKLINQIVNGLKHLHWKDFETLVDLLFRSAGWRRVSLIGETMKFVDIELEEPITKELYQIQVKSSANLSDFKKCVESFSSKNFKKMYFVVHSPDKNLYNFTPKDKNVELLTPNQLAIMIIDSGLLDWLMKKIK